MEWEHEDRAGWDAYQAARARYLGIPWSTLEDSVPAVPRLADGWNSRDPERVAAAFAESGVRVQYSVPAARLAGRAAIARGVAELMDAVPDCSLEVLSTCIADGVATVEWIFRGTHRGDLPGLPARGRPLVVRGASVCVMDGRLIAEERVYWDAVPVLEAAGVIG